MVTDESKYISAGNELATRIQTREIVLLSYIALAGTLISISIANGAFRQICLIIPYLSIAAALLNVHHDAIIGLLSTYMKKLEEGSTSANWHTDPMFIGRVLNARKIRDFSASVFLILSCVAALFISWPEVKSSSSISFETGLWWGGILCVVLTLLIFVGISRFRGQKWPFKEVPK